MLRRSSRFLLLLIAFLLVAGLWDDCAAFAGCEACHLLCPDGCSNGPLAPGPTVLIAIGTIGATPFDGTPSVLHRTVRPEVTPPRA